MLRRCAHHVALTRQQLAAGRSQLATCRRSSSGSAAAAVPGDTDTARAPAAAAAPAPRNRNRNRDGPHHAQPQQLSQRLARVVRLIGAIEGRLDGAPELGLGLELDSAVTPQSPAPHASRRLNALRDLSRRQNG